MIEAVDSPRKVTVIYTAMSTPATVDAAHNDRTERLSISRLRPSPTNPRKTFDPAKMAELTDVVRRLGVIQPIVVRPIPKTGQVDHEIVAGERRWRASKAAGRPDILCIIREYTDSQVLEIQVIENLQREDVHPLEEAEGYAELLKHDGYTTALIAQKFGKDEKFVARRLKLVDLIPPLKEDFVAGKIQIGHAERLAVLPKAAQQMAAANFLYTRGGERHVPGLGWIKTPPSAVRISDLELAIRTQIYLDLSRAGWSVNDAELLPKAGACSTCEKRTGANGLLFDDARKGDHCLDKTCWDAKGEALLMRIEKSAKESGDRPPLRITDDYSRQNDSRILTADKYDLVEKKTDRCDFSQKGLFVAGARRGQLIEICVDPKCLKHRGRYASRVGGPAKKDFWQVRSEKLDGRVRTAARRAIVEEILKQPMNWRIPLPVMKLLAHALLGNGSTQPGVAKVLGDGLPTNSGFELSKALRKSILSGEVESNLPRLMVVLALESSLTEYFYAKGPEAERLQLAVKAFGIDAKGIEVRVSKEMRATFEAQRKKAAERKKLKLEKEKKKKPSAGSSSPAKVPAKRKAAKK